MDVSGWTVQQRMRFPDWCFPNRQLISAYAYNNVADTYVLSISTIALPDPAVIWEFDYWGQPSGDGYGNLRVGLAAAVPTNVAEMDAAQELFPDYGIANAGPNIIPLSAKVGWHIMHGVRKGLTTGGKYLVTETYCAAPIIRSNATLLVSGLPTDMAGWLAHSKV